jgi:membrane-associated phospholipid phosphatase
MTAVELRHKRAWFLFMLLYFTFGYLGINKIASYNTQFHDVSLPFENSIPFIPVLILGYICVYGGVFLAYAVIDDMEDWNRTVVCFVIAATACFLSFYFFPVTMTMRPDISNQNGVFYEITKVVYAIDLPYNCFPSLHVVFPTFAAFVVWRNHRTMRWLIAAMALIVCVSVVFVKQHYIADVVAGLIVAGLSFVITVKTESIWSKWRIFTKQID